MLTIADFISAHGAGYPFLEILKQDFCIFIQRPASSTVKVIDLLMHICSSKGEARRLIQGNGVSIDEGWRERAHDAMSYCKKHNLPIVQTGITDEPYKSADPNWTIDITFEDWVDVKIGKKTFKRIVFV